jgi:hypothetical protein
MRYTAVWLIIILIASSCGTTNHLDKYGIEGADVSFSTTIDPVPDETQASSTGDDDSGSPWVRIIAAIVVALVTPRPDPTMHDESIAFYFEEGFRNELDSVLHVQNEEAPDIAQYILDVKITDCDLHLNDSCCNVRFTENLRITYQLTKAVVFDESRNIEVPLRYCGDIGDSTSYAGPPLTKDAYYQLVYGGQLSALQCAAVDAGSRLADTLATISERAYARRR